MKKTITLTNGQRKVKKSTGFSVRFLIFGGLNYFFGGRFIKTLFAIIWAALTLSWLAPTNWMNEQIMMVADHLAGFLIHTIKQPDLAVKMLEGLDFFFTNLNKEIFTFSGYQISLLGVCGLAAFILVRIFFANNYNRRTIKFMMKKRGYRGDNPQDVTALANENMIGRQEEQTQQTQAIQFNYERPENQTKADIRSQANQAEIDARELELRKIGLWQRRQAGLLTQEQYISALNALDRNNRN